MTRMEALAVARLWSAWKLDRVINNCARREFVFQVVAAQPRLRHLNCFEVLDAVTNEAAWQQMGRSVAAGLPTGNAAEHRSRGQTAAARVVEVEEAAY